MVVADILLICDEWIKPTKIYSFAGLSYKQKGIINVLTETDFLEEKIIGTTKTRSRRRYRATIKGKEFIKEIDRIYELIGITRKQMHTAWPDKNRSPSPSSPP